MTKKHSDPADPAGLPELRLSVSPYDGHSVVTVVISTRSGSQRIDRRLARWHVRLTRADLAGHNTRDVLAVVLGMVMHRLEQPSGDPADWHATRPNRAAVGPGAPDGATGRAWTQDRLPGMSADSDTPGGLDSA